MWKKSKLTNVYELWLSDNFMALLLQLQSKGSHNYVVIQDLNA